MSTETPAYFYIEPSTWESWVAALGFAAASKLAGACMTYFFRGELGDEVKLTKTARALFEGERVRLDNRRTKAAAKAARIAEAAMKSEHMAAHSKDAATNVENSATAREKSAKSSGKPRKNQQKACDTSTPTSPVPAETYPHEKPKPKPKHPQTPTPSARGCGSVTPAEFAAMAVGSGLGYDSPTAYGDMLRAV